MKLWLSFAKSQGNLVGDDGKLPPKPWLILEEDLRGTDRESVEPNSS